MARNDVLAARPDSGEQIRAEARRLAAAKFAFIDALSVAPELTGLDVRVALRLIRYFNAEQGAAWPSIERLAVEVGAKGRSVTRCLARLVATEWFAITQGGGRGHTNHYVPRFERVTRGSGFADDNPDRGVGVSSKTLTGESRKGDSPRQQTPTVESPESLELNLIDSQGAASVASLLEGSSARVGDNNPDSRVGVSDPVAAALQEAQTILLGAGAGWRAVQCLASLWDGTRAEEWRALPEHDRRQFVLMLAIDGGKAKEPPLSAEAKAESRAWHDLETLLRRALGLAAFAAVAPSIVEHRAEWLAAYLAAPNKPEFVTTLIDRLSPETGPAIAREDDHENSEQLEADAVQAATGSG